MKYSRKVLYLIWFSFFAFGVFEGILPVHANASSLIHGFILMVSAVFWCSYHAEENGLIPSRVAIVFCVLIPIVGVPYYLFKGFGFKSGGLKVLWLLLFVLICVMTYFIPVELIEFLFN